MEVAHLGMPLEEVQLLEGRRERVAHPEPSQGAVTFLLVVA